MAGFGTEGPQPHVGSHGHGSGSMAVWGSPRPPWSHTGARWPCVREEDTQGLCRKILVMAGDLTGIWGAMPWPCGQDDSQAWGGTHLNGVTTLGGGQGPVRGSRPCMEGTQMVHGLWGKGIPKESCGHSQGQWPHVGLLRMHRVGLWPCRGDQSHNHPSSCPSPGCSDTVTPWWWPRALTHLHHGIPAVPPVPEVPGEMVREVNLGWEGMESLPAPRVP